MKKVKISRKIYLIIAIMLFFFSMSCKDYVRNTVNARQLYYDRQLDQAASLYEPNENTEDRNKLLRLMDLGMVYHTAGMYNKSNEILFEADKLSEELDAVSISSQTVSMFSNERSLHYKGEDFEKVLISVILALNYIQLNDIDNALVECRRVNEKLELMISEGAKPYKQNAFARYLSALLYEENADFNDSWVDYNKVKELKPDFKYLKNDLMRTAKKLGMLDEIEKIKEEYGEFDNKKIPESYGEVIVILEMGHSPEKESDIIESDIDLFAVPTFKRRMSRIDYAEIFVNGEFVENSQLVMDLEPIAIQNLNERVNKLIARSLARVAVKTAASAAISSATNESIGNLSFFLMLVMNRPDLRSWLTLPQYFHLARFYLPLGQYNIELRFVDNAGNHIESKMFNDFTVINGKKSFLNWRTFH